MKKIKYQLLLPFFVLMSLIALSSISVAYAQSLSDLPYPDEIEQATVESIYALPLSKSHNIRSVDAISKNSFVAVGSYPSSSGFSIGWLGIINAGKLVAEFTLGGQYESHSNDTFTFVNTEFISVNFELGYFYVLGNSLIVDYITDDQIIQASLQLYLTGSQDEINFEEIFITPTSQGLATLAVGYDFVDEGGTKIKKIDFYSATSYIRGSKTKNTKIMILSKDLLDQSSLLLGPYVIDRPMNNNTEAIEFFQSPSYGPMLSIADYKGDLFIYSFVSKSLTIYPQGNDSNFIVSEIETLGFDNSLVIAELGAANDTSALILNSYTYDLGRTRWSKSVWINKLDVRFELDNYNNSGFLSTSAKDINGEVLLTILHFDQYGSLKSDVSIANHKLVKTFVSDKKLRVISLFEDRIYLITIKIDKVSPLYQFIVDLFNLVKESTFVNIIGAILLTLLGIYEGKKKIKKIKSIELYPEN